MEASIAASQATTSMEPTHYQFGFTGNSREYFGIWIVNLLLTIVTLGIYSAWAKVRTNRYFYGNTLVAGSAFDYTADPKKILVGRVIAVVLLAIYQVSIRFFPSASIYVLVLLLLAVPVIYLSSLSFKMRYSLWRGINFRFERNIPGVYLLFLPVLLYLALTAAAPLLFGLTEEDMIPAEDATEMSPLLMNYIFFTLAVVFGGMLLFPLWQRYYYKFVGEHTGFGQSRFGITLPVGKFYSMYLIAFGIAILGVIVLSIAAVSFNVGDLLTEESIFTLFILLYAGLILLYVTVFAVIQTRLTNLVYSNIELENMQFRSTLAHGTMILLYLTNTLAIIFSLGLAIPWVRVRMARYRADNMYLIADNLETITAQSSGEVNAGADAMTDIFDLDIGL